MARRKSRAARNKSKKRSARSTSTALVPYVPAVARIPRPYSTQMASSGPRPKTGQGRFYTGPTTDLVERLCSLTDPFCDAARGARLPDETGIPAIGYRWRGVLNLTSDANGVGAVYVLPSYPFATAAQAAAASSLTTPATWSTIDNASTLTAVTVKYRVVSFGVLVRPMCAPTSASGMLTITEIPQLIVANTFPSGPNNNSRQYRVGLPNFQGAAWIAEPYGLDARTWVSQNTNTSAQGSNFPGVAISVSGAPASTVMAEVEYFLNMEHAVAGGALSELAQPPPRDQPQVQTLTARVREELRGMFIGGMEEFGSFVKQRAAAVIAGSGRRIGMRAAQLALTL